MSVWVRLSSMVTQYCFLFPTPTSMSPIFFLKISPHPPTVPTLSACPMEVFRPVTTSGAKPSPSKPASTTSPSGHPRPPSCSVLTRCLSCTTPATNWSVMPWATRLAPFTVSGDHFALNSCESFVSLCQFRFSFQNFYKRQVFFSCFLTNQISYTTNEIHR